MKKSKKNLIRLTLAAMLMAMSFVAGLFCKNFLTFGIYYRVTFENLAVILAGILLGPFYGAAVGIGEDVISCLMSTNPAVNPVITAGAAMVGFLSGLIAKYIIRKHSLIQYIAAAYIAHLVGQVLIKSVGKIFYFGMPWYGIFIGLAISLAVAAVEVAIIALIMKTKPVIKLEKEIN